MAPLRLPDSDFTLMTRTECQRLVNEYLRWLKEEHEVTALDGACQISTPFLDRHNDAIEIFPSSGRIGNRPFPFWTGGNSVVSQYRVEGIAGMFNGGNVTM
jgi:hypothetical protein